MLSDRPYMRGDYEREKTSVLTWLISALAAGFLIQVISVWIGAADRLEATLGLSVRSLVHGHAWTLLSHAFVHSLAFPLHVVVNLLALYFLGRELLPMLGAKRFLGVFAIATLIGGLAWSITHWLSGAADVHLGAGAAVYAFFTIFACFFPNQQVTFLLFFVFPVTLRPKQVAYFLFGVALLGLFVYEIQNAPLPFGVAVASSAHLGGMLTGFLYYRFIHDSRWSFGSPDRAEMELPRWLKRARKSPVAAPAYKVNVNAPPAPPPPAELDIRAEVDRILDKINSHGFGALTPEERRVLDNAKDLISRR